MPKAPSKPGKAPASGDRLTKLVADNRVAGASGSTGLIGLIHAMKVPEPTSAVLVFLSPAATVIGIELFRFGSRQLFAWLSDREQQIQQRRSREEKEKRRRDVDKVVEETLNDPSIPDAEKQRLREAHAKGKVAMAEQALRDVLQPAEPATPAADRSSDPARSSKVDQSASLVDSERSASRATG